MQAIESKKAGMNLMVDFKKHLKAAKAYDCELCRDSGTVARFTSNGNYKCAGPVPEDARRCYEAFCDCPEGQKMRREERK